MEDWFSPGDFNLGGGGGGYTPEPSFNMGGFNTRLDVGPYSGGGYSGYSGGGGGNGGGGGFDWTSLIPLLAGGAGLAAPFLFGGGNKGGGGGQPAPVQMAPPPMPDYSEMLAAFQEQMMGFQEMMAQMMAGMGAGMEAPGMPEPSSGLPQDQIRSAVRSYLARQQGMGLDQALDAAAIAEALGLEVKEVEEALKSMKGDGGALNLEGLTMNELTGDAGASTDFQKITAYLANKGVSGDVVQQIYNDLGGTPAKLYQMIQTTGGDPEKVAAWLTNFENGGAQEGSWPATQ